MISGLLYLKNREKTKVISLENGRIVHVSEGKQKRENYNGMYENIKIGIIKKKTMLICVFCHQKSIYVSFDDKVFKESEISYRRYYIFTRIKKFKAFYKKKCVVNFNYIFKFFNDDPFLGSDFLFSLIEMKRDKARDRKYLIEQWE